MTARRWVLAAFSMTARYGVWSGALWTFAVLFVPTYVFFGWYLPVIASPRFELPLVPIVYLLLAGLAWEGLTRVGRWMTNSVGAEERWICNPARATSSTNPARLTPGTVIALVIGGAALVGLVSGPWVTPSQIVVSDRARNETSVAIFEYLTQVERPSGKVILGPNANLATWPFYGLTSFEPIPSTVTTWDQMAAFIQDEGASHVVLNAEMVKRRNVLLARYFRVKGDRVSFDTLPPGWTLVYAYPDMPCRYCIYRVDSSARSR